MLSNSKKINTSIKSKVTMSEPATNIVKFKAKMLGLGGVDQDVLPSQPKGARKLNPRNVQ